MSSYKTQKKLITSSYNKMTLGCSNWFVFSGPRPLDASSVSPFPEPRLPLGRHLCVVARVHVVPDHVPAARLRGRVPALGVALAAAGKRGTKEEEFLDGRDMIQDQSGRFAKENSLEGPKGLNWINSFLLSIFSGSLEKKVAILTVLGFKNPSLSPLFLSTKGLGTWTLCNAMFLPKEFLLKSIF